MPLAADNATDAFDFDLPEDLIALRPVQPRDAARLLHVAAQGKVGDKVGGEVADRYIRDLPDILQAGDALVVNITKVMPVRLTGRRVRGDAQSAKIDITLIKKQDAVRWQCFLKPAKRVRAGDTIDFDGARAEVVARTGREAILDFHLLPHEMDATLARLGAMPLPPYIATRRAPDAQDMQDYQTVYAKIDGAVAAPTAGLHFTPDLLAQLTRKGVCLHEVVLHIGAGTFLPVEASTLSDHKMHSEWGQLTADTATALNKVRAKGGRVVCVGTTALRLLESAMSPDGLFVPFEGTTDIFITPDHRVRAADMLLTNFHLPRSTLFMLVCAFSGYDVMQAAYAHAIAACYRFYSYGDACLLENINAIHTTP